MRRAAKRDTAEPPIIQALESVGAEVWAMDYPVDLLVRFRGHWHLLEVKTPRGRRLTVAKDRRQQAQQNFIASTGTPIVRTPIEALKAIGVESPWGTQREICTSEKGHSYSFEPRADIHRCIFCGSLKP